MPDTNPPSFDERLDELLDEALEGTFPASDPPSLIQPHDPENRPNETLPR